MNGEIGEEGRKDKVVIFTEWFCRALTHKDYKSVHRTGEKTIKERVDVIRPRFKPIDYFASLSVPECRDADGVFIEPQKESHCELFSSPKKERLTREQSYLLAQAARICAQPAG